MKNFYKLIIVILCFFTIDFIGDQALKHGLDQGIGLNEHSKILIVGHSHLMMGLDKRMLEDSLGCKVTKHTRSGVGMTERKLMTQMFLDSPYSDSLVVVVIGVDPFSFNNEGLSKNCHTLFYPWINEQNVEDYIKGTIDPANYYVHKLFRLSRYNDDLIKQSIRGWKHDDRNYKVSIFTDSLFEANKTKWMRPITFNKHLMKELEQTITFCIKRKLHVILLQTPILRLLTDMYPEEYTKIIKYYQQLDSISSYVHFINYSPYYDEDNHIFFDPIHLNINGQKIITTRFMKDISYLLK
ncbi:SGNH/GDSL hydrolase family protein [Bacteroides clarus]|uniref:SGNH/GDSL hydrolase family protein n=1 Tax=Bacteroides clarus TaxID=626929 RepID=UPI002665DF56|nr:SGNH/GDSL hydrolase family protein [Bacteroides clarus]